MEAGFASHYGIDLMDALDAGKSWRWFTVRLIGLLVSDTAAATLLTQKAKDTTPQPTGSPDEFTAWLHARARRR